MRFANMDFRFNWCTIFVMLIVACSTPPEYPIEPQIAFNGYSTCKVDFDTIPLHISGQLDTVFVKIDFTDGDGDSGYETTDTATCDFCTWDGPTSCLSHPTRDLFLFDLRDSCMTAYNMPYITETNSNGSVKGVVKLDVFGICCKKNVGIPCGLSAVPVADTLLYQIVIRDKAFHYSNRITLPPVYVHCDM